MSRTPTGSSCTSTQYVSTSPAPATFGRGVCPTFCRPASGARANCTTSSFGRTSTNSRYGSRRPAPATRGRSSSTRRSATSGRAIGLCSSSSDPTSSASSTVPAECGTGVRPAPHTTRARDTQVGRARQDERRDRRDALAVAEHGAQASRERVRQARRAHAHGRRGAAARPLAGISAGRPGRARVPPDSYVSLISSPASHSWFAHRQVP
jgi:hypothetical protein